MSAAYKPRNVFVEDDDTDIALSAFLDGVIGAESTKENIVRLYVLISEQFPSLSYDEAMCVIRLHLFLSEQVAAHERGHAA